MAEKINWNFVVQALNGPTISGAGTLEMDAYDKIAVTIPAGAKQQKVNLAPSKTVSLLVINPAVPTVTSAIWSGKKRSHWTARTC